MAENVTNPEAEPPPIASVFKLLWARRSFRHLSVAAGLHAFVGYGVGQWIASFFIRTYELDSTGEIGTWLGLINGGIGAFGTFFGGWLSDKLGKKDKRWYMWVPGLATVAAVPFALATYASNHIYLALLIYTVPVFLGYMYLGPTIAATHGIVSLRTRALASAILFFILNLIGLGLGPFLTGALSDLLQPTFGSESLRYALMIVVVTYVWSAAHYMFAAKTIRADLSAKPAD